MSSRVPDEGWYRRSIEELERSGNPNLRYLVDFMNKNQDEYQSQSECRCTVYGNDKYRNTWVKESKESGFRRPPQSRERQATLSRSVIYILQDLSDEWIEYLGRNYGIHPSFFLSQLAPITTESNKPMPSTTMLPSVRRALNFVSLGYFEAVCLKGHLRRGSTIVSSSSGVERRMWIRGTTFDSNSRRVTIALVERHVSYWRRIDEQGQIQGSLTVLCATKHTLTLVLAVLLVDAPLPSSLSLRYHSSRRGLEVHPDIRWQDYGGGYLNFSNGRRVGPQSLWDDLSLRTWGFLRVSSEALSVLPEIFLIQQKIVLSRWMVTLTIMQREFNSLNLGSLDDQKVTGEEAEMVLNDLMSVQNLIISSYSIVERSLEEVGVEPIANSETTYEARDNNEDPQKHVQKDWRFLLRELKTFQSATVLLLEIYMRNLQIHDSKRVDYVNKLAGLFVYVYTPLGVAYGVLSMGGDFAPGQRSFWVFFVVGLLLVAVTILFLGVWQWSAQLRKLVAPKKRPPRSIPKNIVDERPQPRALRMTAANIRVEERVDLDRV